MFYGSQMMCKNCNRVILTYEELLFKHKELSLFQNCTPKTHFRKVYLWKENSYKAQGETHIALINNASYTR